MEELREEKEIEESWSLQGEENGEKEEEEEKEIGGMDIPQPPPAPTYKLPEPFMKREEKENIDFANEINNFSPDNLKRVVVIKKKEKVGLDINSELVKRIKNRSLKSIKKVEENEQRAVADVLEQFQHIPFINIVEAIKLVQNAKQVECKHSSSNGFLSQLNWPFDKIVQLQHIFNCHNLLELSLTNAFSTIQNRRGKGQKVIVSLRNPQHLVHTLKMVLKNKELLTDMLESNKSHQVKLKARLQAEKTFEFAVKLLDILFAVTFEMFDSIEKCSNKFDRNYKIKSTFSYINQLLDLTLEVRYLLRHSFGGLIPEVKSGYCEEQFIKSLQQDNLHKMQEMKTQLVETYGDVLNLEVVRNVSDTMGLGHDHLKKLSSSSSIPSSRKSENVQEEKESFPLHRHASSDSVDELKQLISSSKQEIDQKNSKGLSPLLVACFQGNEKAAKVLLEGGADVNSSEEGTKNTCLHLCLLRGSSAHLVDLLLSSADFTHKFDINQQNSRGETPFHLASRNANLPLLLRLLELFPSSNLFLEDSFQRTFLQIASLKIFSSSLDASKPLLPTNSKFDFSPYFNSPSLSDVTFVVSEGGDETKFYAHRVLLCAQSSVFKQLLQSESWKEANMREIELKDVSIDAFELMLSVCYKGTSVSVTKASEELLLSTLELADRFLLNELRDILEVALMDRVSLENVYWMFESVKRFTGLSSLKKNCCQLILQEYHIIQNDEDHRVIHSVLNYISTRKDLLTK